MAASVLQSLLEAIASERSGKFERSFHLADQLLAEYGTADLAERLYRDIPESWPWEVVADLYSILIWQTPDEGKALTNTTERWLIECASERQARIALNLGVYPFLDRSKMEQVLTGVAQRFPDLSDHCSSLIESRAAIRA
jgi:hypothetical protein